MADLERSPCFEIDGGSWAATVVFSVNGEYLVSGHDEGVRVWRVEDGAQVVAMPTAGNVRCLAVSRDGRWIAAGTKSGRMSVWDASTYKQVIEHKEDSKLGINGVDFSPDSKRLLVATVNCAAIVWDVAERRQVLGPLHHGGSVVAAKYSPRGGRIATATNTFVRIFDSNDGRSLVATQVKVSPWYNSGLLWSREQLFVVSDNEIKQVEPSSGSASSVGPAPDSDRLSCIAVPHHGQFIAYSAQHKVAFWETSTRTPYAQLELAVPYPEDIRSIALSPDDRLIAIGGMDKKIIVHHLPRTSLIEPKIYLDDTTIDLWCRREFDSVDKILTRAIISSANPSHRVLARRALVRARLENWDAAINDVGQSLQIKPSAIGFIAQCITYLGKGERYAAYRACDSAFEYCHPTHISFFLLIKAIIVFMAGERDDAISRVDNLIVSHPFDSICYIVQAYMFLLLGISHVENGDYQEAIQWFEHALTKLASRRSRPFLLITLISGWNLDRLGITIRQRLCKAQYDAGWMKEGCESLVEMVNTFQGEVYATQSITNWVSEFAQRYLSAPWSTGTMIPHGGLDSTTYTSALAMWTKSTLASRGWRHALTTATTFTAPRFTIYQAICDHLEVINHMTAAIECFNQMNNELASEMAQYDEWATNFRRRCATKLVHLGDAARDAGQHDDAITQYSAALSLNPPVPQDILEARMTRESWDNASEDTSSAIKPVPSSGWRYHIVLTKWVKSKLKNGSWKNALTSADNLNAPRFMTFRALCEHLEALCRVTDAIECLLRMEGDLAPSILRDSAEWVSDFKSRCLTQLQDAGNNAMGAGQYDEAIFQYSATLSLDPTAQGILIERSKAYLAQNLWEHALKDANKVITLDPSSPWGYERKYAALLRAGDHENATNAYDVMISKMSQSSEPRTRDRFRHHVDTNKAIYEAIQVAIHDHPPLLINVDTGRLLGKSDRESSFKTQKIYAELIFSSTTHVDHSRIEQEVTAYYRYATFSHKWEANEPPHEKVLQITVYNLEDSPAHHKLKMFCKTTQDLGYHWAWSDTCCINKADNLVLQEALVSMFKWYEGSAMTIVFLCDVSASSRRGALWRSIWNTRGWTFQEYHASKVVRFYTKDWTPYLNLDIHNHKESPEIISEMEEATGVSAQALRALRPGLDDIREKLRLASTRQTERIEDAAYSLLGIFTVFLSIVYGEKHQALGRLLALLLASSGNATILAWTGLPNTFNSCLPRDIAVFSELPTSHIPPAIQESQMDMITTGLRTSSLNLALVTKFYNQLDKLPVPSFTGQRMKLPCITFKLSSLSTVRSRSECIVRAQTTALGTVEFNTKEDLSQLETLYLIHPWIDYLLDQQPVCSVAGGPLSSRRISIDPLGSPGTQPVPRPTRVRRFLGRQLSISETDEQRQALRLLARLRQPFGALLITPNLGHVSAYRRVAAGSLITVQVVEITPAILNKLVDSVHTIDVL